MTLVIERIFKAGPERVFKAWVDPAVLITWWGPIGFTTPEVNLDVRNGGRWHTIMRAPDGSPHRVSGVYREILPPKRLVFSWGWEEADGQRGHETEVEVTFTPTDGGTHMRLVQRIFQSAAQRDNHRFGWADSFEKLAGLFA